MMPKQWSAFRVFLLLFSEALLFFVFDQSYGFVDWVKVEEGNDKAWETIGKRAKDGAITRLQD